MPSKRSRRWHARKAQQQEQWAAEQAAKALRGEHPPPLETNLRAFQKATEKLEGEVRKLAAKMQRDLKKGFEKIRLNNVPTDGGVGEIVRHAHHPNAPTPERQVTVRIDGEDYNGFENMRFDPGKPGGDRAQLLMDGEVVDIELVTESPASEAAGRLDGSYGEVFRILNGKHAGRLVHSKKP